MQIYDAIGAVIVLALIIYWLVFRSDPRVTILVAIALLLSVVVFTAMGDTMAANVLGNVFFYTLALGVTEMAIEASLERMGERKGVSRKERPFFGEVPKWMNRMN